MPLMTWYRASRRGYETLGERYISQAQENLMYRSHNISRKQIVCYFLEEIDLRYEIWL